MIIISSIVIITVQRMADTVSISSFLVDRAIWWRVCDCLWLSHTTQSMCITTVSTRQQHRRQSI